MRPIDPQNDFQALFPGLPTYAEPDFLRNLHSICSRDLHLTNIFSELLTKLKKLPSYREDKPLASIPLADLLNISIELPLFSIYGPLLPSYIKYKNSGTLISINAAILAYAQSNTMPPSIQDDSPEHLLAAQEAYNSNPSEFKRFCYQVLRLKDYVYQAENPIVLLRTLDNNTELIHDNNFKTALLHKDISILLEIDELLQLSKRSLDFFVVNIYDGYGYHQEFLPVLHMAEQDRQVSYKYPLHNTPRKLWYHFRQKPWIVNENGTDDEKARSTLFLTSILKNILPLTDSSSIFTNAIINLLEKSNISGADPYQVVSHPYGNGPLLFGDFVLSLGAYRFFKQLFSSTKSLSNYINHPHASPISHILLHNNNLPHYGAYHSSIDIKKKQRAKLLEKLKTVSQKVKNNDRPRNHLADFLANYFSGNWNGARSDGRPSLSLPDFSDLTSQDTALYSKDTLSKVLNFYDNLPGSDFLAPSALHQTLHRKYSITQSTEGSLLADSIFSLCFNPTAINDDNSPNSFLQGKISQLTQPHLDQVFHDVVALIKTFNANLFLYKDFGHNLTIKETIIPEVLLLFSNSGVTNFSKEINSSDILYSNENLFENKPHLLSEIKKLLLLGDLNESPTVPPPRNTNERMKI